MSWFDTIIDTLFEVDQWIDFWRLNKKSDAIRKLQKFLNVIFWGLCLGFIALLLVLFVFFRQTPPPAPTAPAQAGKTAY